jgi:hypothetical protein
MEREVGLHRVDLAGREEALAQRRHAEVDEGVLEGATAQPAWVGDVNSRIRPHIGQYLKSLNVHAHSRQAPRTAFGLSARIQRNMSICMASPVTARFPS